MNVDPDKLDEMDLEKCDKSKPNGKYFSRFLNDEVVDCETLSTSVFYATYFPKLYYSLTNFIPIEFDLQRASSGYSV